MVDEGCPGIVAVFDAGVLAAVPVDLADLDCPVVLLFDLRLDLFDAMGLLLIFLFALSEGLHVVVLVLCVVGVGGHGLVHASDQRVVLNLQLREFAFFAADVAGRLDGFVQHLLAG
ncbi:hypothetical protein [Alloscardovia criceti]|uniref:hypothetical protein n=1 Tax=Alloscardovia criceti TaxID=356828 RepID=UPI0012E9C028|nr:hypothetical protein [Alloscardovia criceti]